MEPDRPPAGGLRADLGDDQPQVVAEDSKVEADSSDMATILMSVEGDELSLRDESPNESPRPGPDGIVKNRL